MNFLKIITLFLGLSLSLVCSAREYNLDLAMAAASSALPEDAPREFALYDINNGDEEPETMLEFLRAGKGAKVFFAATSPKAEYIHYLLFRAIMIAENEKFSGLKLIIVSDRVDPEMFEPILKDRGISVFYAAY